MNVLRRALDFISSASPASAPIATESALPPRERLQAAFADRSRAEVALREASEALQAAEHLIGDAEAAARKAMAAERAATDATSFEAADALRAVAKETQRVAAGAREQLPALSERAQDTRRGLDNARFEVQESIRAVLLSEIEADFKLIEDSREGCAEAHLRISGLAHMIRYGKLYGVPHTGSTELLRRLQECLPRKLSEDESRHLAKRWVAFAQQLRVSSDATLDDT